MQPLNMQRLHPLPGPRQLLSACQEIGHCICSQGDEDRTEEDDRRSKYDATRGNRASLIFTEASAESRPSRSTAAPSPRSLSST